MDMLFINNEKLRDIEAGYRRQRRQQLARAFTERYPGLSERNPGPQFMDYLDIVIEDAKILDIVRDSHVIDCAAVGLMLADQMGNNELIALVSRTLNNKAWDAGKRLSFIFTQLLPMCTQAPGSGLG
jgi:hypothetical protein